MEKELKNFVITLYEGGNVSPRKTPLTLKTSAPSLGDAIRKVIKENPGSIITYCAEE